MEQRKLPNITKREHSFSQHVVDSFRPECVTVTITGDPQNSMSFAWVTKGRWANFISVVEMVEEQIGDFDSSETLRFSASWEYAEPNYRSYGDAVERIYFWAVASGLSAGTAYLYRCGDMGNGFFSEVYRVVTAPEHAEHFTFLLISDLQAKTNPEHEKITRNTLCEAHAQFSHPAFVMTLGDMVNDATLEWQWEQLFESHQMPLFSSNLVVPVAGNHEMGHDQLHPEKEFLRHFALDKDGIEDGTVYSFDYGHGHFAVLNTQRFYPEDVERQLAWLRQDLNVTGKKWKFVAMHSALYSAGWHALNDWDIIDLWRPALAPILEEYGVDVVLHGHDHIYTRSFIQGGRAIDVAKQYGKAGVSYSGGHAPLYLLPGSSGHAWYPGCTQTDGQPWPWQEVSFQPYEQVFMGISVTAESVDFDTYFCKAATDKPGIPQEHNYNQNFKRHLYEHFSLRK